MTIYPVPSVLANTKNWYVIFSSDCNSRRKLAHELGLCYDCLNSKHTVSFCRNNSNCKKNWRRNHKEICEPRQSSSKVVTSTTEKSDVANLTMLYNSAPNKVHCCSRLLPRGTFSVITSDENWQSVRCLFDTDSQATSVAAELNEKLKL